MADSSDKIRKIRVEDKGVWVVKCVVDSLHPDGLGTGNIYDCDYLEVHVGLKSELFSGTIFAFDIHSPDHYAEITKESEAGKTYCFEPQLGYDVGSEVWVQFESISKTMKSGVQKKNITLLIMLSLTREKF